MSKPKVTDLVVAVDSILQVQAKADAVYFAMNCGRPLQHGEPELAARHFLKAYRWQYIFSGAGHPLRPPATPVG